jgi:hypothetical protein
MELAHSVGACTACGSQNLTWHCQPQNRGGAQDGLLKINEIGVTFFLGCDECSETLLLVQGDEVAERLTKIQTESRNEAVVSPLSKRERKLCRKGLHAPQERSWCSLSKLVAVSTPATTMSA